jgi:hypothetical protein
MIAAEVRLARCTTCALAMVVLEELRQALLRRRRAGLRMRAWLATPAADVVPAPRRGVVG